MRIRQIVDAFVANTCVMKPKLLLVLIPLPIIVGCITFNFGGGIRTGAKLTEYGCVVAWLIASAISTFWNSHQYKPRPCVVRCGEERPYDPVPLQRFTFVMFIAIVGVFGCIDVTKGVGGGLLDCVTLIILWLVISVLTAFCVYECSEPVVTNWPPLPEDFEDKRPPRTSPQLVWDRDAPQH